MMDESKYQVIAATDLRNRNHELQGIRARQAGRLPPLVVGIATRELAEAKVAELLAEDEKKENAE